MTRCHPNSATWGSLFSSKLDALVVLLLHTFFKNQFHIHLRKAGKRYSFGSRTILDLTTIKSYSFKHWGFLSPCYESPGTMQKH